MNFPLGQLIALARRWLAAGAALVLLTNCAGGWSGTASDGQTPNPFAGIALPEGYSLDHSETLILGEGERWTGRLVYSINSSNSDMFEFIRRQMPALGWTEVAVVRASTSVLTYASSSTGRVATIHLTGRYFPPWGSHVSVVVGPTGEAPMGVAPPGRRSQSRGAPRDLPWAAPRGDVVAQPLR